MLLTLWIARSCRRFSRTLAIALVLVGATTGCGSDAPDAVGGQTNGSEGQSLIPACDGPTAEITSVTGAHPVTHPVDGEAPTDLAVDIGTTVTVTVQVAAQSSVMLNSGQLVIALPGISADSNGPAESGAKQLAASAQLGSGVANNQTMTLSWTPNTAGVYPLIEWFHYAQDVTICDATPPSVPTDDQLFGSEYELATVTVG